jgi:hypothetical protein
MANIPFREIWYVDFEFRGDPGENPWVVCMVACELNSAQKIQLWRDELLVLQTLALMRYSSPITARPS